MVTTPKDEMTGEDITWLPVVYVHWAVTEVPLGPGNADTPLWDAVLPNWAQAGGGTEAVAETDTVAEGDADTDADPEEDSLFVLEVDGVGVAVGWRDSVALTDAVLEQVAGKDGLADADAETELDGELVVAAVAEREVVMETVTEGEGLAAGTMHPGTCPQYAEFKKSMRPACLVAMSGSSGK